MKNQHYINSESFFKESKFFSEGWVFVGLETELKSKNDFITLNTAFLNIVVQNFSGELKAFDNICQHRYHSIQTEYIGNRPLVCKYHSWGYDRKGCTRMNKDVRLMSHPIEKAGIFVFINAKNKSNQSLQQYLGNYYTDLLQISSYIDSDINVASEILNHKANWKLLVENVIECYHCQSVHKESLGVLGMGKGEPYNFKANGIHNSIEYPLFEEDSIKESRLMKKFENRPFKHNSYYHILIAPNLFISSTSGKFFYVGRLDPISESETNLILNFKSSKFHELKSNLIHQYLLVNRENTIKVVKEDREIVENIQKNLDKVPDKEQFWGGLESRLNHYYNNLNIKYHE